MEITLPSFIYASYVHMLPLKFIEKIFSVEVARLKNSTFFNKGRKTKIPFRIFSDLLFQSKNKNLV